MQKSTFITHYPIPHWVIFGGKMRINWRVNNKHKYLLLSYIK